MCFRYELISESDIDPQGELVFLTVAPANNRNIYIHRTKIIIKRNLCTEFLNMSDTGVICLTVSSFSGKNVYTLDTKLDFYVIKP